MPHVGSCTSILLRSPILSFPRVRLACRSVKLPSFLPMEGAYAILPYTARYRRTWPECRDRRFCIIDSLSTFLSFVSSLIAIPLARNRSRVLSCSQGTSFNYQPSYRKFGAKCSLLCSLFNPFDHFFPVNKYYFRNHESYLRDVASSFPRIRIS